MNVAHSEHLTLLLISFAAVACPVFLVTSIDRFVCSGDGSSLSSFRCLSQPRESFPSTFVKLPRLEQSIWRSILWFCSRLLFYFCLLLCWCPILLFFPLIISKGFSRLLRHQSVLSSIGWGLSTLVPDSWVDQSSVHIVLLFPPN